MLKKTHDLTNFPHKILFSNSPKKEHRMSILSQNSVNKRLYKRQCIFTGLLTEFSTKKKSIKLKISGRFTEKGNFL